MILVSTNEKIEQTIYWNNIFISWKKKGKTKDIEESVVRIKPKIRAKQKMNE